MLMCLCEPLQLSASLLAPTSVASVPGGLCSGVVDKPPTWRQDAAIMAMFIKIGNENGNECSQQDTR